MTKIIPGNAFNGAQPKDTIFQDELKIFAAYLRKNTVTCSMAAEALNIPQKNLCRYKRALEIAGQLWQVKKAHCKLTGFPAQWLTTDPAFMPPKQPTLIDGIGGNGI